MIALLDVAPGFTYLPLGNHLELQRGMEEPPTWITRGKGDRALPRAVWNAPGRGRQSALVGAPGWQGGNKSPCVNLLLRLGLSRDRQASRFLSSPIGYTGEEK